MTVRPLSAALQKKAEEDFKETPSKIKAEINTLREWIEQQPHLKSVKLSDQWLVAFLRGCKYNMDKTKGKLNMYYTLKASIPEFYGNRDPLDPDIQELLKLGLILPLKKCVSDDSPRIVLSRPRVFGQTKRSLSDLIKISLMINEILLLEDDNFTIAGNDLLVDAKDVPFSLVFQWTPLMAKNVISCSEKALSVRLKSMHILQPPFYVGAAIKLFRMFLAAKLKNRMHTHNKDLETLYQHIDKSILPEEYGGTDGSVQELIDYWKAKVESYRDWFIEKNLTSDESKTSSHHTSRSMLNDEATIYLSSEVD